MPDDRPTSQIPRVAAWLLDRDAEVPTADEFVKHGLELSVDGTHKGATRVLAELLHGNMFVNQGTREACRDLLAQIAGLERFANGLLDRLRDAGENPTVIEDWRTTMRRLVRR